jgi:Rap1-interacting factor 1 N terminal
MVQPPAVSSAFEHTPRPPTPPKESAYRQILASIQPAILSTSTASPSSSNDTNGSSGSRRRVEFSGLENKYHIFSQDSTSLGPTYILRSLLPSRERKSTSSILKPFDGIIPIDTSSTPDSPNHSKSPHSYASFALMLESVVRQLASDVRGSKLDAYILVSKTSQAYDWEHGTEATATGQSSLPDLKALESKIGLLMQFIQRDLVASLPGILPPSPDYRLITETLKLVNIFVSTPTIARLLTDEFSENVVDRAIAGLKSPSSTKGVVNHYLQLLGEQRFSSRVMNTERTTEILAVLSQIEERHKGNGVTGLRLHIYRRLLLQARPVMISRAADWISHFLSALLHNMREIRRQAISFGELAGFELGSVLQVSRALVDAFNNEKDGKVFAEVISHRIENMLPAKGDDPATPKTDGDQAPHIWAVVVLFLRSRPQQFEHWEHRGRWARVIMRCFNCNDSAIKAHTNTVWNTLIFAVAPDLETSENIRHMLFMPLNAQLGRRGSKKSALAMLRTLIYYAMRPGAPDKQLDLYWNEWVSPSIKAIAYAGPYESKLACELLDRLLNGTRTRAWKENRISEARILEADDLPILETRWIRSRSAMILSSVELLLSPPAGLNLWTTFTKAIADAGSKEIRISKELMSAVASIVSTLFRLWSTGLKSLGVDSSDSFIKCFGSLLTAAMESLGTMCFTDRHLRRNSRHFPGFEVAETPSERNTGYQGGTTESPAISPFLFLFGSLFMRPTKDLKVTPAYFSVVRELLEYACTSRGSRYARLALLRECVEHIKPADNDHLLNADVAEFWRIIAEVAYESMSIPSKGSALANSQSLNEEYKSVLEMLKWGCRTGQHRTFDTWQRLLTALISTVTEEVGYGGVVVAVVEPLAVMISTEGFEQTKSEESNTNGDIILRYASAVIGSAHHPKQRHTLVAAQKALGEASSVQKFGVFDPLRSLEMMIGNLLEASYDQIGVISSPNLVMFLHETAVLVDRYPVTNIAILLKRLQSGLSKWVVDGKRMLEGKESCAWEKAEAVGSLSQFWSATYTDNEKQVINLWTKHIIPAVKRIPQTDSTLLGVLETLVSSGLESRRKVIVNSTITVWNSTFGDQTSLAYPPRVAAALNKLRGAADLQLPSFPDIEDDEVCDYVLTKWYLLTAPGPRNSSRFRRISK